MVTNWKIASIKNARTSLFIIFNMQNDAVRAPCPYASLLYPH